MVRIDPSEITPEHIYISRRKFMVGIGALLTGAMFLPACFGPGGQSREQVSDFCKGAQAVSNTDELGSKLSSCEDITHYNNFYEFTTSKTAVAELARDFKVSPWTVTVGGLVRQPRTFDMDDLRRKFPPEERTYRLRCVEGWSMVIPWLGFPLAALLREVEPESNAGYVRFETLYDPEQMPGQKGFFEILDGMPMLAGEYDWPYIEGLRLDEAMHDLTILATGLYGKDLPPQDGAPLRLVVPWKYGFKSIKSIVKIDLVEEMPVSFWMKASPSEYGFYANVNPDVPHPRWPQSSERRIGEFARRRTLPFNGYAEEVAHLYAGMDLKKFF